MCCLFLYINKYKKSKVKNFNKNNINKKGIKCPKCNRIFYTAQNLKSHFWCFTDKELNTMITNNI